MAIPSPTKGNSSSSSSSAASTPAASPSSSPVTGRKSPALKTEIGNLGEGEKTRTTSPVPEASSGAEELLGATAAATSAMSSLSMAEIEKSVKTEVSTVGWSHAELYEAFMAVKALQKIKIPYESQAQGSFLNLYFMEGGFFDVALQGLHKMSTPSFLCPLQEEAKVLLGKLQNKICSIAKLTLTELIGYDFPLRGIGFCEAVCSALLICSDDIGVFMRKAEESYDFTGKSEHSYRHGK